ncbi:hypothetical protein [Fodinicola acaciae]|uniref:hypothetical protein n=1 Tax=Fodinicola acaciae TaxID=2681555 RepID=UPI0013CF42FC|nr:hypothetical protein [Fodinicola acaciae]
MPGIEKPPPPQPSRDALVLFAGRQTPQSIALATVGGVLVLALVAFTLGDSSRPWIFLVCAAVAVVFVGVMVFRASRTKADPVPVFAADRRGVWYRTSGPELEHAPWHAIGSITAYGRYLILNPAAGRLPGSGMSGQVTVAVWNVTWGGVPNPSMRSVRYALRYLAGDRVEMLGWW